MDLLALILVLHFWYIKCQKFQTHPFQMLGILHTINEISKRKEYEWIRFLCLCYLYGHIFLLLLTYTLSLVYRDKDNWAIRQNLWIPFLIKSFDHIRSHVCECHHFLLFVCFYFNFFQRRKNDYYLFGGVCVSEQLAVEFSLFEEFDSFEL